MKLKQMGRSCLLFLLSLIMFLTLLPTGFAEAEPEAGQQVEEPEEDAGFSASDDWETRLLLMLQEKNANPETIGAGYYNFATGEEHYYNGDQYRVSGSMYKVPLNMLFLDWIAAGKIDMEESIGGYRYSQLLEGTIIDSNNDYARMLWDYAGATIQTVPDSTYYHRYRILIAPIMGEDADEVDEKYYENNFFTPRQMITCLRQLYDGGEKYDKLIEAMQRAEPEKYFKLRERRFNIAHKYGWYAEDPILYLNDCALCFTDDPIAIVLFTSGTENAYGVMADFCTLMCDYAQEKHAERTAREQQEQEAAELAAQRDKEEAERVAAAESAQAATTPRQRPTEPAASLLPMDHTAKNEEQNWLHELTLGPILALGLIAAGVFAGVIWFSVRHRFSRIKLGFALVAILLTASAFLLCLPATAGLSYISDSGEDAGAVVEAFFDALKRGDAEAADACLAYGGETGLSFLASGEGVSAEVYRALQKSWDATLLGTCSVEKARAWQEVQLRVLDLSEMKQDLQTATREQLLELARTQGRENVYDEEGNYRPAIAGEAYDRALLKLLQQPEDYYASVGLRVELALTRDGWKLVPTRALLSALSGSPE